MKPPLLHRLLKRLDRALSLARVAIARARGVVLGPDVRIAPACDIDPSGGDDRPGSIVCGPGVRFHRGVVLHPYGGAIKLGAHVSLGPGTVIYGHGGVEIGDDTLVAMHCRIVSSEHTIPALDRRIRWEPDLLQPTRIGRDVWLGAGVTVLGGVTIGDGCVVGAGAVVTRDLPPGSIARGVPARVVGQRPSRPS